MAVSSSKLTSKYQATVPEPIRRLLGIEAGDSIVFEVSGNEVFLRKASPLDLAFARGVESTLSEWNSENDEQAYRSL